VRGDSGPERFADISPRLPGVRENHGDRPLRRDRRASPAQIGPALAPLGVC
jgi:hypothetical protein